MIRHDEGEHVSSVKVLFHLNIIIYIEMIVRICCNDVIANSYFLTSGILGPLRFEKATIEVNGILLPATGGKLKHYNHSDQQNPEFHKITSPTCFYNM